jgi:hypothetical protein
MCPPFENAGDEIPNGIFLSKGIAEYARVAAGICIVSMNENKESTNRRDVGSIFQRAFCFCEPAL